MNKTMIKNKFDNSGYIYFEDGASLFSEEALEDINSLVLHEENKWEYIEVGDADENNSVYVTRFMTDVEFPKVVNPARAYKLISLLMSEKVIELCEELLGCNDLYIRRCQANRMAEDAFVGRHLDVDSNPDYEISIVIQLGEHFEGGNMLFYKDDSPRKISPNYRSIIIADSKVEHEVTKVTKGSRTSLVYFVCRDRGKNKRDEKLMVQLEA